MHTILVVDDEPFIRTSMASLRLWQEDGYDFRHEAGNGQQALDLLALYPEIDIILLDLSMPVMDGIAFLKALPQILNATAADRGPPVVIVLSAHDNFDLVRQAFTLGVQNYLLKTEVDGDSLKVILDKASGEQSKRRAAASGRLDDHQREFLASQLLRDLLSEALPADWESAAAGVGVYLEFPLCLWGVWIHDFETITGRYKPEELASFKQLFLRSTRQLLDKRGGGQVVEVAKDLVAILSTPAVETGLFAKELKESLERYLSVRVEIRSHDGLKSATGLCGAWSELKGNRPVSSRIVVMARRFLRENFTRPTISLDELSSLVGVSRNHLSYEFARETGETITEYLAHLRVEEACRLLVSTTLKVYEISERVGYPNVEHFCRVFKKVTGISPNRWSADTGSTVFRDIHQ